MISLSSAFSCLKWFVVILHFFKKYARRGSTTAATSKMEHFVIMVNGWKPLTIIIKSSILDVAAGLDPPLIVGVYLWVLKNFREQLSLKKLLQTNTCAGRQFVKIVVISNIIKIMKLLRYWNLVNVQKNKLKRIN